MFGQQVAGEVDGSTRSLGCTLGRKIDSRSHRSTPPRYPWVHVLLLVLETFPPRIMVFSIMSCIYSNLDLPVQALVINYASYLENA